MWALRVCGPVWLWRKNGPASHWPRPSPNFSPPWAYPRTRSARVSAAASTLRYASRHVINWLIDSSIDPDWLIQIDWLIDPNWLIRRLIDWLIDLRFENSLNVNQPWIVVFSCHFFNRVRQVRILLRFSWTCERYEMTEWLWWSEVKIYHFIFCFIRVSSTFFVRSFHSISNFKSKFFSFFSDRLAAQSLPDGIR